MSKIYGYVVIDKDGNRAPTKRTAYDTKNAAAAGFYQYSRHAGYYGDTEIAGKKLREQDKYRVVGLVVQEEE